MKMNLVAPITPITSYGISATNILKHLFLRDHEVALFPIGDHPQGFQEDHQYISRGMNNQNFCDKNAPSVRIWHAHQSEPSVGRGLKILFCIFELDDFTDVEKYHIDSQDAVFVCSQWARQVVLNRTSQKNVFVVPLGVDREIFNENVSPLLKKGKTTRFISIGKLERRKLHWEIIDGFNAAFNPNDDVELILFWDNVFMDDGDLAKQKQVFQSTKMGTKIRFIPRVGHPTEIAQVMASCDCSLQISHAEGWLMPALDALSMGIPLIACNYSAPTEYLTKNNALLIEPTGLEIASDGVWFKSGIGSWMSFGASQKEQLIEHMRTVYKKKREGLLGANMSGIQTAKRFSWNNTVSCMMQALKTLGTE